jgi:putative ubiquitin-RnfH superfamily antitoxin RatB of RatAB toxin-antitoxin module
MAIITRNKKTGTFRRTVKIPADKIGEFERIAKEKGWIIDNLAREKNILKNIPKQNLSQKEMQDIDRMLIADSKEFRKRTFQYE